MYLVQHQEWSLDTLAILGDLERPVENREFLKNAALKYPDDPLIQMGLAAYDMYLLGEIIPTQAMLQGIVDRHPDLLPAQAMLGESLVDDPRFPAWHAQLPSHADENPDIWYVRGLWARRNNKLPFAARCFWETLRRVPVHRRANYHLGQVLDSLDDPRSEEFLARSGRQFELTHLFDVVLKRKGDGEAALKRIVELLEQTGRIWEARAWAETSAQYFPKAKWPRTAYKRMTPLLRGNPPQVLPAANLAAKYDFSSFPAWDEELSRKTAPSSAAAEALSVPSEIRFEVADAGLDFIYFNGDDPATPGVRMFEQPGGGVAVLDLDNDGWPDLYFTQGAKWIQGENAPRESPQFADRIFRNVEGKRFVDVTGQTGLGSQGFGAGASIGDFNGDGFADLYVANVGRNRLYQNNGDGTFSDVTKASGLHLSDWTSSCAVVDLNADGLPDLYDVNYVTGAGVYSLICKKIGCSPSAFQGQPDRLLINRGDGTFAWIENATPKTDTKGLGLLAFNGDRRNRPCLFVANDQVANLFLVNSASDDSTNVRLENRGLQSGLAYNMDGLTMACMGIAADDADGDGRLDLFVTNFKEEPNTLYLQDRNGLFNDRTNVAGLYAASLPKTGWGTQFLDADLDGDPDLVVANGHVYPEPNTEYQMQAQCFHNVGGGRFEEIPSRELGPYFEAKHSGRSVAKLDWNRDGLMDFVVSNINEPAAILTNVSPTQGHSFGVRLHAVATARDAIGSVVEVEVPGRRWTKQLVAGDGFQASNERLLHFGLGANETVSSVKVTWPSGRISRLKNLPADGTLELVEDALGTYERDGELQSLLVEGSGPGS